MKPTLIVTRPAAQGAAFGAQFGQYANVILSPLIEIVPKPVAINLTEIAGFVFTSVHGVNAANLPAGFPAFCVGPKTALAAAAKGLDVMVGPGDASGLVKSIVARGICGPLAHLRGRHTSGNVAQNLSDSGVPCSDYVAYEQVAIDLNDAAKDALRGKNSVVLPLFSPRTATILSAKGRFLAPVHLVVMSNKVKEAAKTVDVVSITVAAQPTGAAMVDATVARLLALQSD